MKKTLVISNDSYGRNNLKVQLKEKDIEKVDLHDLTEMLIAEYPEQVTSKIDYLGDNIVDAEEKYNEDYTEDYTLIYFNGGEKMYTCRLSIMDFKTSDVDLIIE